MSEPPREAIPVLSTLEYSKAAVDYVVGDLACKQCGHNLRTLGFAGVCTECGTPVEYSLHGYLLRYADPAWVRRVARGCMLLIIAIALMVVGGMATSIWGMATAFSKGYTPGTPPHVDTARINFLAVFIFAPLTVLLVAALVLITAREPSATLPPTDSAARVWLCRSLWLYVASCLFGWTISLAPTTGLLLITPSELVALNAPIGMAVFTLMVVLAMRYFSQLMARMPRPGLVKFANICFWGVLIGGGLMTLGIILNVGSTAQALAAVQAPTTAPTTSAAPAGAGLPPGFAGAGLTIAVLGCGGCATIGFNVAAYILLILVCSALFRVVRATRESIAPPTASPG